jgi:hypothetical protein
MRRSLILKISRGMIPLLIFFRTYGQVNLVPNPSFESYTSCPIIQIKPPQTTPWLNLFSNVGSYANSCSNIQVMYPPYGVPNNAFGGGNYQYANSGNGYLVFKTLNSNFQPYVNNRRIYQAVKLVDSLKIGKKYYCGFYTVLTDSSKYATNNISMSISNNIVLPDTGNGNNGNLQNIMNIFNNNNPIIKDTKKWVLVSGIYIAQGGEQYITIGNFKNNSETTIDTINNNSQAPLSVYCLDDVFVYELSSTYCATANAGRDTAIHIGDSVFIGSLTNGIDSIKWLQNGLKPIDSTKPGFWVKPMLSSFYVLQQVVNGCFSADTVFVNVQPLPLKFITYNVISRNEKSVENIWQTANEINVSYFNILKGVDGVNFKVIGKIAAKNKSLNEYSFIDNGQRSTVHGSLYYRIESVDNDGRKQYSETKTLNFKPQTLNGVSIYPNPAKDFVTVECKGAKEIQIIDHLGRIIYKQNSITEHQTINTKQFAKGLYIVKVITHNGEIKTEKLIVE